MWGSEPCGARTAALGQRSFGGLVFLMDSASRENWLKIAACLERSTSSGSWFYARARAIAEGQPDPLAELDEFLP